MKRLQSLRYWIQNIWRVMFLYNIFTRCPTPKNFFAACQISNLVTQRAPLWSKIFTTHQIWTVNFTTRQIPIENLQRSRSFKRRGHQNFTLRLLLFRKSDTFCIFRAFSTRMILIFFKKTVSDSNEVFCNATDSELKTSQRDSFFLENYTPFQVSQKTVPSRNHVLFRTTP